MSARAAPPAARGERLLVLGDAALLAEVAPWLAEARGRDAHGAGVHAGATGRWRYKHAPVRGKARLRLYLRRHLFRVSYPPLAEHANLGWLRAHAFGAPEPGLAGVVLSRGLPAFQFLFTRELEGHPDLAELLPALSPAERWPWLAALARDAARMHALGFVHRDLFARNVLADPSRPGVLAYVDAWRGGPGPDARGPLHDLASFDLDAQELLGPEERARFLAAYREARAALGRPVAGARLEAGLARRRERLARRRDARARRRAAGAGHGTPPAT